MLKKWIGVLVSAFIAWPTGAFAAGMEEEESLFAEIPTVITASLKRQTLDKVPGTMSVITRKQIETLGFRTLIEALRTIPGFAPHQTNYGPEGLWVRGYKFGVSHIRVMLDGHKLNQVYDEDMEAWWDMPLDNVAQIEIIRGPGSSLYGSDALDAVVNIITRKEKMGQVSVTGGSFQNAGATAVYNTDPDKAAKLRFDVSDYGEQGPKLTYKTDFLNPASAARPSVTPLTTTRASGRFEAGTELGYKDFSLEARRVDQSKDWSEGYVNVHSHDKQTVTTRVGYVEARYHHAFTDKTALSFSGSTVKEDEIYAGTLMDTNVAFPTPAGAYYDTRYHAKAYNGQGLFETAWGIQSFLLGSEYGRIDFPSMTSARDFINNFLATPASSVFKPGAEVSGSDPDNASFAQGTHRVNWAVFGQDIVDLQPVTFIVGARLDQYQVAGTAFSPRVAAIWEAPWGQTFKASFGQAFSAPYSSIRYGKALGFVGNPDLSPQVIRTYELAVQNSYAQRLHYGLTVFKNYMSNAFTFDSARTPAYHNDAQYEFLGWELEGKYDVLSSLSLWGNYSLSKGKDSIGTSPRFGPEWTSLLGAVYAPTEKTSFSAYGEYVDKHFRYKNASPTAPAHKGYVPGYATLNAAIVQKLTESLSLSVTGTNLLDREIIYYNDQGTLNPAMVLGGNDYPGEGRRIEGKVSYKWGDNK